MNTSVMTDIYGLLGHNDLDLWPLTTKKLNQQTMCICIKCWWCIWPWTIKVQICNNSKSRLGSITSSGMSEDFPLDFPLWSFLIPADTVSPRENSSSCITENDTLNRARKICIQCFTGRDQESLNWRKFTFLYVFQTKNSIFSISLFT